MMRTVLRVIVVMVFCVAGLATGRRASTVAAVTIQLEPVLTTGLDSPVYVTHARDGSNRLFIRRPLLAAQLIEDGYDIRTLQELLGHNDVKTTI